MENVVDLFLKRYSYKFPKGYVDLEDKQDQQILESIFNRLGLKVDLNKQIIREQDEDAAEEAEKATTKDDLIQVIQDLDLTPDQLTRLKKLVSNLSTTDALDNYLNKIVAEKNIPDSDATKFSNLVKEKGLEAEFVKYFENPANLDLNSTNFTDLIPDINKEELLDLYRKMGSTIASTVSIGPGEIIFIILFKNVKKRDSKGDLDVDGENVELKASTKGAGAVVAKGYNRGDWKTTRRKGRFEEVIGELGWSDEELRDDALKVLYQSLNWPAKLAGIYDFYVQDDSFNRSKFIEAIKKILSNIYTKSNWQDGGKYFNLDSYITNNDMDDGKFKLGIARELVNEYQEAEGFDGILYVDKNGNTKYLQEEEVINDIGQTMVISTFSDDVPRLVYKP